MKQLMNRNGLPVPATAKDVFEELMRGTGSVMGEGGAIFIETPTVHEKQIVVSRSPVGGHAAEVRKFPSNRFQEAFGQFVTWASVTEPRENGL